MPKLAHEAIVQLIRHAPGLIPGLIKARPVAGPLSVTATELVDLALPEFRADAVILCGRPSRPRRAFIVEVQLRPSARKRRVWPLYLAGYHARHGCDVVLVIITLDPTTARSCARPIVLGDGCLVVRPRVLTREKIPAITDFAAARAAPERAVLSALVHADEPGAERIALAALVGVQPLDDERGLIYADFVASTLPQLARVALEKLMDLHHYEFKSDFARRYLREGKAEGKAEGLREGKAKGLRAGRAAGLREGKAEGLLAGRAEQLLELLELRGLRPSARQRQRVLSCTDEQLLKTWAARVLTARTLAEVFSARPPRQAR